MYLVLIEKLTKMDTMQNMFSLGCSLENLTLWELFCLDAYSVWKWPLGEDGNSAELLILLVNNILLKGSEAI